MGDMEGERMYNRDYVQYGRDCVQYKLERHRGVHHIHTHAHICTAIGYLFIGCSWSTDCMGWIRELTNRGLTHQGRVKAFPIFRHVFNDYGKIC